MVCFFLAGKLSIGTEDLDCTMLMCMIRTLQRQLRDVGKRVDECISERPDETNPDTRPWRYLSDKSKFTERHVFSGGDHARLFGDGTPPTVSRMHSRYVFTSATVPGEQFSVDAGTVTYVTSGDFASRVKCAGILNAALADFKGTANLFKASDPVCDEFRAILRCVAAWALEQDRCCEDIVVVALGRTTAHCGVFRSLDQLVAEIKRKSGSDAVDSIFKCDVDGDLAARTGFSLRKMLERNFKEL